MIDILSPENRKALTEQLMRHEGSRRDAGGLHVAYRDTVGVLTIGYGHNLIANPIAGLGPISRITEVEARKILDADIARTEADLQMALPWCVDLDPIRYAVLVNMAFNLGIKGLVSFRNTLMDVRSGNYGEAAGRMLDSKWSRQVGDGPGGRWDRAEQLAEQMATGGWH